MRQNYSSVDHWQILDTICNMLVAVVHAPSIEESRVELKAAMKYVAHERDAATIRAARAKAERARRTRLAKEKKDAA